MFQVINIIKFRKAKRVRATVMRLSEDDGKETAPALNVNLVSC